MEPVTVTLPNGIVRTYTPVICNACNLAVDPLTIFPKGICLDCYKQTPDAYRPITARELARMWGAN